MRILLEYHDKIFHGILTCDGPPSSDHGLQMVRGFFYAGYLLYYLYALQNNLQQLVMLAAIASVGIKNLV